MSMTRRMPRRTSASRTSASTSATGATVAVAACGVTGCLSAARCRMHGSCLADLRPGDTCRIVAIDPAVDPKAARRLVDLGFAPDENVTVLRRAPLGDPVVFRVAEYEVALRRAQTAGIRVLRTS